MIERRPALGKGLSALIPEAPEQPRQGAVEVDIDLLTPNEEQPRLSIDELRDRKRRGTQPYENAEDVGHRPTEMSGASPAASLAPAWSGGIAGRAAELADSYPERARV